MYIYDLSLQKTSLNISTISFITDRLYRKHVASIPFHLVRTPLTFSTTLNHAAEIFGQLHNGWIY